ncbi:MAG: BaiN/RdsA family NAD(P)/FAD-dependent oxidoreductase, partial [Thermoguttaceae bacterium]
ISGGGHCNLTHATDSRGIVEAFGHQGRFLHSSLAAFNPTHLVQLMEAEGVPTTVLPNGKILPASGRATDVLAAFLRRLGQSGAVLATEEPVLDLTPDPAGLKLVTPGRTILAGKVILTTGGCSYPRCGTTGDGYRWAAALGHTVVPARPALVPILTDAQWVKDLQGITIPDVGLRVVAPGPRVGSGGDKPGRRKPGGRGQGGHGVLAERRGSLLFTHFGLSGPVALDVSRGVSGAGEGNWPHLLCDFLPGMPAPSLEAALADAAGQSGRRQVTSLLETWLPHRLVEALVAQAQVPGDRKAAELSRVERTRLVEAVKQTRIATSGTLGFAKAEVTAGGVALGEVDSRTMASKLVPGLFIAGEVLDLDGFIGGYNLQAAFSTGYLAGESV